MRPVFENFNEFLMATEVHQRPDATKRYEYGANPLGDDGDLPYNFERRPEIGIDLESPIIYLEKIESLSSAALNKMRRESGSNVSPYIKRELHEAYVHMKEAYLRMMDYGR